MSTCQAECRVRSTSAPEERLAPASVQLSNNRRHASRHPRVGHRSCRQADRAAFLSLTRRSPHQYGCRQGQSRRADDVQGEGWIKLQSFANLILCNRYRFPPKQHACSEQVGGCALRWKIVLKREGSTGICESLRVDVGRVQGCTRDPSSSPPSKRALAPEVESPWPVDPKRKSVSPRN